MLFLKHQPDKLEIFSVVLKSDVVVITQKESTAYYRFLVRLDLSDIIIPIPFLFSPYAACNSNIG